MSYDGQVYGATNGNTSTVGTQLRTNFYQKKALIDVKKERFFGQLADVTNMPKNMGKTIKCYHYLPLLDDANLNDQGIDANGVGSDDTSFEAQVVVTMSDGKSIPRIPPYFGTSSDNKVHFTGIGTSAALAADAAGTAVLNWITATTASGGLGQVAASIDAAEVLCTTGGAVYALGFRFADGVGVALTGVEMLNTDLEAAARPHSGNLYGSSKDIGTISGKLPYLSETGGRVNRVGFKRITLEGTIAKFGFFDEYTQETLDFDTDADLEMHINREMLRGANEITEDALQIDLINAAGLVRYPGTATSVTAMTGIGTTPTEVSYGDLQKLSVDLDNNRCPKHTKIITGTRMVDTKVINAARILYCGSEMQETLERMKDYFQNQAFIPLAKYAAAGSEINGEIGSIGNFRIVIVPEMLHKAGVGVNEGVNTGYRVTSGKYDAYPLLVVGSESFTTIGFQTSGNSVKFKVYHKAPGEDQANTADPYGETGFMSIKWYYGFMALRPEQIALVWSVARW
jgi:N4-gp56 family major capsid protein